MAGPGNILIKIGAEAGQAVSELRTVDKALGSTMTSSEKMHAGLKKAAVPAAAALVALGAAAIDAGKAAAEDQAAQERLAGVLERTTGASADQVKANEDWIASISRASGVADDELRPALAKLASATGDLGLAQKDLKVAMDVSAATGATVEQSASAIAKAYDGSTGALKKLVPGLDQATLKSKDMSAIMDELSQKTGGAMAAQAETATGKYAILTNQMNELKESLGAGLLPIMQEFLPILSSVADWAAKNTTVIKVLVGIVAALAGGILVANAALKAYEAIQIAVKAATVLWTGAQIALNAVLSANPIGLVVIALGALVAAFILAYKNSETFRNIVQAAMGAVKVAIDAVGSAFKSAWTVATSAFNWITANWKNSLFFFGPIASAVSAIAGNFGDIKSAATAAFNFVTDAWKVSKFAFGPIESAVHGIASAFSAITGAVQSAIGAVEALISALGRIHVPSIHIPNPFGKSLLAPAPAGLGVSGFASSSDVGAVTINVYGAIDPEGTARAIRRILGASDRRMGRAR